ncbi:hypothetical protein Tco_0409967 [Tanacetum coccineum]
MLLNYLVNLELPHVDPVRIVTIRTSLGVAADEPDGWPDNGRIVEQIDDDSEGFVEEMRVWVVKRGVSDAPSHTFDSFPLTSPGLPIPPSVIEDLSTRLGNLEYGYRQLVKKVIQVSNAEVAASISIGEIGPRVFAVEGLGAGDGVPNGFIVHGRFEQIGLKKSRVSRDATQRV